MEASGEQKESWKLALWANGSWTSSADPHPVWSGWQKPPKVGDRVVTTVARTAWCGFSTADPKLHVTRFPQLLSTVTALIESGRRYLVCTKAATGKPCLVGECQEPDENDLMCVFRGMVEEGGLGDAPEGAEGADAALSRRERAVRSLMAAYGRRADDGGDFVGDVELFGVYSHPHIDPHKPGVAVSDKVYIVRLNSSYSDTAASAAVVDHEEIGGARWVPRDELIAIPRGAWHFPHHFQIAQDYLLNEECTANATPLRYYLRSTVDACARAIAGTDAATTSIAFSGPSAYFLADALATAEERLGMRFGRDMAAPLSAGAATDGLTIIETVAPPLASAGSAATVAFVLGGELAAAIAAVLDGNNA